eukprot:GSMAST32.ASY1.ANO1.1680.1 assembled CDS
MVRKFVPKKIKKILLLSRINLFFFCSTRTQTHHRTILLRTKNKQTNTMKVCVIMTNGTNDPLKCELAVLAGFGMLKNGHEVDFLMMGEAGSVIDCEIMKNINGFGLPPIQDILGADIMKSAKWYI